MRLLKHLLIAAVLAIAGPVLAADPWPTRPVRLIVPLPPGGGGDMVARLVAAELSTRLGQPVVVDNRAGAGSIIGTQAVASAPADGYTLLFATDFHAINGAFGKLPFDSIRDFAPVAQVVELQIILLARPGLNVKTLPELLAAAKKEPKRIVFGSPGTSSPHFLAAKLLQQRAGAELLEVPFQGTGPTSVAFLGGHVDLMFSGVGAGLQLAQSGKAVALAVTGTRRDAVAPAVPTVAESGYPGYAIVSWMGVLAPAGTPVDVVTRVNTAIREALADKAVADKLAAAGFTVVTGTPQAFGGLIAADIDKLRQIIQAAGAVAER